MGFTTNAHLLALTYFIVVACREGVRLSSSAKEKYLAEPTNINELKELWCFGFAPFYYVFTFAADWMGNVDGARDLHYFRNMLFHVVFFPAVLAVLFSNTDDLMDPYQPEEGVDKWVALRYKMLLVSVGFEVLSIYTGHGGFIIGFGQSSVGVFAFGIFALYGLQLPRDDDFTNLMKQFATDTFKYYVADAKLWFRLTRASPAFVDLMAGVTNQDQMQVRAAIEAMSDLSSMSPTDHISNNINLKDRQGRTIVHQAAVRADNQILRTILDFPGINVNICDKFGHTPLYMAVRFGELTKEERHANIRALLASGANSTVGDDDEDDLSLEVEVPAVPAEAKSTKSKSKSNTKSASTRKNRKGKAASGAFSDSEGEESAAPATETVDDADFDEEEAERIQREQIPKGLRFNSPGRKANLSIFAEGKRKRKPPARHVAKS